jgi:hypothetical protein
VTRLKGDTGSGVKRRSPNCNHLAEWRRVRDALHGSAESRAQWMDVLVGTPNAAPADALDKLVELLVHVVQVRA